MKMTDCIFCKIVAGEVSSRVVYEDDVVMAFLDVSPRSDGHILVIPKDHCQDVYEASDDQLSQINIVAKKMAILLKEKLGISAVNIVSSSGKDAQQTVFHLHFHIIPRKEGDNINVDFVANSDLGDVDDLHTKLIS